MTSEINEQFGEQYSFISNNNDMPKISKHSNTLVPLSKDIINLSLCSIRSTIDGLSQVATKFICIEKSLSDINKLENFIFLRYINVSYNQLTSLAPLANLRHLNVIKASHNELNELPTGNWPSLAHLELDFNRINKLNELNLPRLIFLNLNDNEIKRLSNPLNGKPYFTSENLPNLHTLSLAHNFIELDKCSSSEKFPSLTFGLNLNNLKALFIGNNNLISIGTYGNLQEQNNEAECAETNIGKYSIKSGTALGLLPKLSVLHMRNTSLVNLEGFSSDYYPNLEYLNLRENQIATMEEIKNLCGFSKLQTLILTDNPVYDTKDYRLEVRMNLTTLRRLDKDIYTVKENEEADELVAQMKNNQ